MNAAIDKPPTAVPARTHPRPVGELVRMVSIVAVATAATFPAAKLFEQAYHPGLSPARRAALVSDFLPLLAIGTGLAAWVMLRVGSRRCGSVGRLLWGEWKLTVRDVFLLVVLAAALGFATPAVQSLLGALPAIEPSRNIWGSPGLAVGTVIGLLGLAIQEEIALRGLGFELAARAARNLRGGRFAQESRKQRSFVIGIGAACVVAIVAVTHLPDLSLAGSFDALVESLAPRLLPAIAIIAVYLRRGLVAAIVLHWLINLSTLALVPATLVR
ncbi:MAG: CPBP family intramembrane metalloprotease [Planctomycetaceae bacterium]|nr:CPBP family intramembrane metalloprotease [Planctomycetaceae bacterium]